MIVLGSCQQNAVSAPDRGTQPRHSGAWIGLDVFVEHRYLMQRLVHVQHQLTRSQATGCQK